MQLLCGFCNYLAAGNADLVNHVKRKHRHHPKFKVSCSYPLCTFTSKSWASFKVHMSKKHRQNLRQLNQNDSDVDDENVDGGGDENGPFIPETKQEIYSGILSMILKLESKYRVSQVALNEIVSGTRELIESIQNHEQGQFAQETLAQMSSQAKRATLYKRMWSYIEPQKIFLGKEYKTVKGRPRKVNQYGYYIPIDKVIQAVLHSTNVLNWIENDHFSHDDIMRDFCDGTYIRNSPYFQAHPEALQIILFYDDAEFCNPIGHRTKKHSMGMFYWTLGNFPPSRRSCYSSIFLLAVAKTKHLKKWGLHNLLSSFIITLQRLDTGIQVIINGIEKEVHGRLIAAPCDSLGSASLGGYKMPGAFALKPCRSCNISSEQMQRICEVSKLRLRTNADHDEFEKIWNDESLSKQQKVYWSKWFGINCSSPLRSLHYINLQKLLVHDPMHVLLEGVVQMNLLLLMKWAVQQKILSIQWLNTQLQSFRYSYIDELNKPELFEAKNLLKFSKVKQNAASMLTLCYVLPLILKKKAAELGVHYDLFMTLMRIVTIAFSPTATLDTGGELEVLVGHYLSHFKLLYPNKSKTPKMHFLLHLINQVEFGPLKYCSVIRMEAKHNFFKQHSWKNFRNLPLSLAVKHQKNLCFELGDSQNSTYLVKIDEMKEGSGFVFDDCFPHLKNEFRAEVLVRYNLREYSGVEVRKLNELVIEGIKYKAGCGLLFGWEDKEPIFAEVDTIAIFRNTKFFVLKVFNTEVYDSNANAYIVNESNTQKVATQQGLKNKWPLPIYSRDGDLLITNRVGHFGSGLV